MGGLLSIVAFAAALPVLLGIHVAYTMIAKILAFFLWVSSTFPDDIAQSILASGLLTGILVCLGVNILATVL